MKLSLSPRDRKLLLVLAPIALLAAFWFAVLGPKRAEAARVKEEVASQTAARDAAVARVGQLARAKRDYASDYEILVRLGKAVPSTVDMPSLLLQLDEAARGTGIDFRRITPGPRSAAPPAGAAAGQGAATSATPPAGAPAPGAAPTDTRTSRQPGATPPATAAPGAAALDTVPLDLELQGRFFDLADFFHRQKRFVALRGGRILVDGRLMSVEGFSLSPQGKGRKLSVEMHATVYLSPKATPAPAPAARPVGRATPAASGAASASAGGPPAATVVP